MKRFHFSPDLLRAAVYGSNDGIITTFAVVAGVAGAGLSDKVIIILGIANMIADGLSMGIGDYLGERSEQLMRKRQDKEYKNEGLWRSGLVTFVAFVIAGSLPLLPYFLGSVGLHVEPAIRFPSSIIATAFALFFVGSLRTLLTGGNWLRNGLEMLSIGAIAAVVAYFLGAWVESVLV